MKKIECQKLKSWCKRVKLSGKIQIHSRKTKIKKVDRGKEMSPDELDYKCKRHIEDLADVSSVSQRSFL